MINKTELYAQMIEHREKVQSLQGQRLVIKYGGSAMRDPECEDMIIESLALIFTLGLRPVLVHGGGPAINSMISKIGLKTQFVDGLRVCDPETAEVSEMVLSGKVNKELSAKLVQRSIPALGISGRDAGIFTAEPYTSRGKDLGRVGSVSRCEPKLIELLLEEGYLPILSPFGSDSQGERLNINADSAAQAIAIALRADHLLFLSDVPGILAQADDPSSRIPSMNIAAIERSINDGTIHGGMIPKVNSAIEALQKGVHSVHIIDGKEKYVLLKELFEEEGVGTRLCL